MKFEEFLKIARDLPIIESEVLLVGVSNSGAVKVQISRWQKAGKLIQLKRGVYLLTPEYRKIEVYTPHIAAVLKKPSYISLEKALEFHSLIPEAVPVFTSVTTKRQGKFECEIGLFEYRHIKGALFWGYSSVTVNRQTAFIAYPEKALLDLIYLNEIDISLGYLGELRLQNVDKINIDRLFEFAKKFKKPKILRTAEIIKKYVEAQLKEEKTL